MLCALQKYFPDFFPFRRARTITLAERDVVGHPYHPSHLGGEVGGIGGAEGFKARLGNTVIPSLPPSPKRNNNKIRTFSTKCLQFFSF